MRPYDIEPNYVEELMMSADSDKYRKYKEQSSRAKLGKTLSSTHPTSDLTKLQFL